MHTLILRVATRLLAALILVFAVYLLFRGHNAPGGGFVAALVAGTGFALISISEDPSVLRKAIRLKPERVAMGGLGLAILSGAAGLLTGGPFLAGIWWIGPNELAAGTPLLFDLGVFLAVLGAIMTIILALEES